VGYLIKSKAISSAIEVTLAEKELSRGMTKLPGFNPLLKVRIEMAYDNMIIVTTAMTFATSKTEIRLEKADSEKRP
jgi:hypothetical protein